MRRAAVLCIALTCLLCLAACAMAEEYSLREVGVTTVFPTGWTVVVPDTVADNYRYFDEPLAEIAAANMRTEGVQAIAFSPSGDAAMRVIAREGDADARLYYDIERYTTAMRNAIKDDFLNKDAWALTGYRYTDASWSNKEGQGRILNLAYTVREGEEIIARGQQAYTIRGGMAFTLDLRVEGRKVTSEEQKLFAEFVAGTTYPDDTGAPLLPVGLTMTTVVPEETYKAEVSLRGETMKGARVSAWLIPDEASPISLGEVVAGGGGAFRLDVVLPEQGEWRLYIKSEMDGYEMSQLSCWVDYNAKRLPVTFTSYPTGDVYDAQIVISGKTIAGVTIQCMEGETNRKTTTGSDGSFSFTLDRAITGNRTVVLSMTKKNFDNRRFDITFNRQWDRADYVKYLSSRVESLSFKNLTENAEKYAGRLVRYSGQVLNVGWVDQLVYIQLGVKQDADGRWTERIVAVGDGVEVLLSEGDQATLYFEVTTETYAFSEVTLDGDEVDIDLPAVKLLTYEKEV